MVEPLTLGAIVAALVARAFERAESKAVDRGEVLLRRMVDALRQRLSRPEEQAASTVLARLEETPDSPSRQHELAELLDQRANALPDLRKELEALVAEAKRAGVAVDSIVQTATGDGNVQVAAIADSEINATSAGRPSESRPPS